MKKTFRIFSLVLTLALFAACGNDEDSLTNSIDFSSPYAIKDSSTDSILHHCYLLYEKYGVSVLFNDTVATQKVGTDAQGNDIFRYETIDLNWNFQSHDKSSVTYSYDYLQTDAEKSQALSFAEIYLNTASSKMRPFTILLVDTLYIKKEGSAATKPQYHNGFRSLVVTQLKDFTTDDMHTLSDSILRQMVLSRVQLDEDLVARFGAVSSQNKYYGRPWVNDGVNGGLGCVWNITHMGIFWKPQRLYNEGVAEEYIAYSYYTYVSTVEEFEAERASIFQQIGRYGFICGSTSYNDQLAHLQSPDNVSQDLTYYVNTMLEIGETEFMERYGASSMVKKKYDILADYIENELGINLDF